MPAMLMGILIASAVIALIVIGLTIWVTNKAYSRRWEGHNDPESRSASQSAKVDPIPAQTFGDSDRPR